MSRNNDVFKVLVTSGNQAVLAANKKVTELLPGQIGVFDYETNLSIAAGTKPKNWYTAVGVGANSTLTDIMKSSGSHVQGKNVAFYSFRPHTAGAPMKAILKGYTANCNTEYGIKLEVRNQEIYRTQGYNAFVKTFSVVTGCCEQCGTATCPSEDANEVTLALMENINNDPSKLIKAYAVTRQAVTTLVHGTSADIASGAVIEVADVKALIAFNKAQASVANYVYTDLVIETITKNINDFAAVNPAYFYPRESVVLISKVIGFECNGTVDVLEAATFEEGNGYDIKQLEYEASGWGIDSPYRVSTLGGIAFPRNFNASVTTKYDQFAITYDQYSIGAWLEYYNNLATIIAVPEADTTTRNGLVAIFDGLLTQFGFDALADDAAAANTTATVVEKTEDKTKATDGLG